MRYRTAFLAVAPAMLLAACHSVGPGAPGDEGSWDAYAGVAPGDILHFSGTEPFWGGSATDDSFTYTTPDRPDGWRVAVRRFAGRNGLSFSGMLQGQDFVVAVSPGKCSDGMSDRVYPFFATVRVMGQLRSGCGWSDAHPFTEPPAR